MLKSRFLSLVIVAGLALGGFSAGVSADWDWGGGSGSGDYGWSGSGGYCYFGWC